MRLRIEHISLLLVLVLMACEKVIDVTVKDAETQFVIEAVIKDSPGHNYVLLSKSSPLSASSGELPKVSGAEVLVTDQSSNVYTFSEVDTVPGMYTCSTLEVLPSSHYYLTVNAEGKTYTAESITYSVPVIDTITAYLIDNVISEVLGYVPYQVNYVSTDNALEQNYYQAFLWVNGKPSVHDYFGNDEFINGQQYEAPFIGDFPKSGDTVKVALHSCDQAYYDYLYSFNNQGSSPFSPTPSNPISNLSGTNIVGYFAAFTTDTLEVILP